VPVIGSTVDAAVWADLLLNAALSAEQTTVQALREAEAYRTCLLEALRLLRDEQVAHAQTRARYETLLDEFRGHQQAGAA
jgi:hypothetical protein